MVAQNPILVEAVVAKLLVALVLGTGVRSELLAVGVGFPVRRRIGYPRQRCPVIFFQCFVHLCVMGCLFTAIFRHLEKAEERRVGKFYMVVGTRSRKFERKFGGRKQKN